MQSIHGSFSIHRTQTVDGKHAILLVPNPVAQTPLMYAMDDEKDESAEVHFRDVQGGNFAPNEYLTLLYPNDYEINLGPYIPIVRVT
jgi:hypothetical protein